MKGLHGTSWLCREAHSLQLRAGGATPTGLAVLAPFLTSLPLELLRVAAPRLGLSEREIAAEAIDLFLEEEGF